MKKSLICIILCLMTVGLTQCESLLDGIKCDSSSTNRIGAMCKDGTRSNSIGSGTCSSHGGVDYWLRN
jgi:hypothetical protein